MSATLTLLVLALQGPVTSAAAMAPSTPLDSSYNLHLQSPGGAIPVKLKSDAEGNFWLGCEGGWKAVGPMELDGDRFELPLPPYRSRLIGTAQNGQPVRGTWQRDKGDGWKLELPFASGQGCQLQVPDEGAAEKFRGRWRVQFSRSEDYCVGVFRCEPNGEAQGTFLTNVGDYGHLTGTYKGDHLELSCFDGAHAFLFKAKAQEDGTLKGDFWSRGAWHETWTATRDPDVQLPDGFGLTRWTGAVPLAELAYPDLELRTRKLDDPAFAGKARILVVFGSWCPNCNDLTKVLKRLHATYGERGLSVLGLAFEFADDPEQRALAVREYMNHHGATWPVLLAGSSDKAEASAAFPLVDEVRAYPTTVFMDGSGNVKAVYTGFSGPATGGLHEELVHRFETLVEELLGAPEEDGNTGRDGR